MMFEVECGEVDLQARVCVSGTTILRLHPKGRKSHFHGVICRCGATQHGGAFDAVRRRRDFSWTVVDAQSRRQNMYSDYSPIEHIDEL
jgi:hypothetical protein